jgi:glycosyltransferase involved in cell wall biosynthesis
LKISIITINYQNKSGLIKTCESVFSQTYSDIEFIVIDGASKDGSVDYLNTVSENIDYWISESDRGVYHAMNKGVLKSTGEYLIFMNSGDCFYDPNVIDNFIKLNPLSDIVYGLTIWADTNLYWNPPNDIKLKDTLSKVLIPHQATFYKRKCFEEVGYYKEEFSIISDWGILIELITSNYSLSKISLVICNSAPAGLSNRSMFIIHSQKLRYILKYRRNLFVYYFICLFKDYIKDFLKYKIKK